LQRTFRNADALRGAKSCLDIRIGKMRQKISNHRSFRPKNSGPPIFQSPTKLAKNVLSHGSSFDGERNFSCRVVHSANTDGRARHRMVERGAPSIQARAGAALPE
jgi:hypothetical protein